MLTPSSKTDLWRALLKGFALFSVSASVALSAQDFHSDRDKHETNFRPVARCSVVSRSLQEQTQTATTAILTSRFHRRECRAPELSFWRSLRSADFSPFFGFRRLPVHRPADSHHMPV